MGICIWEGPARGRDQEAGRLVRRTLQQQRILRDDGCTAFEAFAPLNTPGEQKSKH
jgi:hypothetical protein